MTATWLALARHDVAAELARVKAPITCKGAGCAACCLGPVPLTREEWAEIAPLVTDAMRDRARADALRCPALGTDGRCEVYEARPLVCRGYASHSPPRWCSTESGIREVRRPVQPVRVVVDAHAGRALRMLRDWLLS